MVQYRPNRSTQRRPFLPPTNARYLLEIQANCKHSCGFSDLYFHLRRAVARFAAPPCRRPQAHKLRLGGKQCRLDTHTPPHEDMCAHVHVHIGEGGGRRSAPADLGGRRPSNPSLNTSRPCRGQGQPALPCARTEEKKSERGARKRREGCSVRYRDAGAQLEYGIT